MEIKAVLKMKEGKACGQSGIIIEMVKTGGYAMLDVITDLVNLIIKEEQIPEDWDQSTIINCFKGKANTTKCDNCRGLKLLEHTMNLERIVDAIIRQEVDIDSMQFGFIRLVKAMYNNAQSRIQMNGSSSEPFKVSVGVHQVSVLSPLLFIIVMEVLSRELRVSCLWELLYGDDHAILSNSLVDYKNRLAVWKTSLELHGLRININNNEILVSSAEHIKISARNPKCLCGVCTFGVGGNSKSCTSCELWVHNKCSGTTDHLTDSRNFVCRESTFKYFGDTIGQYGVCSDTVSTRIVSS